MCLRKILACIFAAALLLSVMPITLAEEIKWDGTVATAFASGTGTEDDPFIIETPQQLARISSRVKNGETFEGQYFLLTTDINLNGSSTNKWLPIGGRNYYEEEDTQKYFSGIFDGGGHTVENLYYNNTSVGRAGLFGIVCNGTVKNVTVAYASIKGKSVLGAVVGRAENAKIINCHNNGSSVSSNDYGNIGGVVGSALRSVVQGCTNKGTVSGFFSAMGGIVGAANSSKILDCTNNGTVKLFTRSRSAGGTENLAAAGGILGEGYASTSNPEMYVENCLNFGSVVAESNQTASPIYHNLGGIVGYMFGTGGHVYSCINSGTVDGTSVETERYRQFKAAAGGIIGYSNGASVKHCTSGSTVGGEWDSCAQMYVGGLIGYAAALELVDSQSTGNTRGSAGSPISNTPYACVGGLIGYVDYNVKIDSCYNTSTVGGSVGTGYQGSTTVQAFFGGLVGIANQGLTVTSSFNEGKVNGNAYSPNRQYVTRQVYVGGLGGRVKKSTFTDCYNVGEVYCSSMSVTNSTPVSNLGGAFGMAESEVSLTNFYAACNISAYDTAKMKTDAICVTFEPIMTNVYYKDTLSTVTSATALTNEQMKDAASFVGFDFENVWMIETDNYPTLVDKYAKEPAETPEAPVVETVTQTTVTLVAVEGQEYRLENGNWQKSAEFVDLTPNTTYRLYARTAETEELRASEPSEAVVVTTLKEVAQTPEAPTFIEVTDTMVVLTEIEGLEYRCGDGEWQTSVEFTGLSPNTEYTFYARVAETDEFAASEASGSLSVTTLKTTPIGRPGAPKVLSIKGTTVELAEYEGLEYRYDGGEWQSSPVFKGLTPNTDYTFYMRVAESNTTYAGPDSDPLVVSVGEAGVLGDVNGDENIDSTDARLTLQYFVGTVKEDAIDLNMANVSGDDKVDSTDARLILQYFVGTINRFPAE